MGVIGVGYPLNISIMGMFKGLKSGSKPVEITKEDGQEIVRCAVDPIYFIEKYIKIIHPDRGVVPFELWDFQRNYIECLHTNNRIIVKFPRQCGKSTTTVAYITWYVIFNEHKKVAILANKEKTATELINRLKDMISNLPPFLQPWIESWSVTKISLQNGCEVTISSSSESAIRGLSGNIVYLDEFAFIPDRLADDFFSAVYPVISAGKQSKLLITSTPNGLNHFYDKFVKAKRHENTFVPLEIKWDDVPGRDEQFKLRTIEDIGQQKWDQEYDCKFLGSQATLIKPEALQSINVIAPVRKEDQGRFRIYEDPLDRRDMDKNQWFYLISVDPAMGTMKDSTVAHVLLVKSNIDITQVAVYEVNDMDPSEFSYRLENIGKLYNDAHIIVETNGQCGVIVCSTMWKSIQYPNMIKLDRLGGYESNAKSKRQNSGWLKIYIEKELLKIQDRKTLNELSSFIQVGSSYKAEPGRHDDHVTAFFPAIAYIKSKKFFGNIDSSNIVFAGSNEQIPYDQVPGEEPKKNDFINDTALDQLPPDMAEYLRESAKAEQGFGSMFGVSQINSVPQSSERVRDQNGAIIYQQEEVDYMMRNPVNRLHDISVDDMEAYMDDPMTHMVMPWF